MKQLVCEGVVIVAFDGAGETEVSEDVVVEFFENCRCSHVSCGEKPDESAERISYGKDVIETVRWWCHLSEEIKIEDFHWFGASVGIDDLRLCFQAVSYRERLL